MCDDEVKEGREIPWLTEQLLIPERVLWFIPLGVLFTTNSFAVYMSIFHDDGDEDDDINPYPTAFPYGNGMVLHFYQQQESSTTKTVHKVINKGLKTYV